MAEELTLLPSAEQSLAQADDLTDAPTAHGLGVLAKPLGPRLD